jgi:hypothetical protein
MKIGFFGDSFCAWNDTPVLPQKSYPTTYIKHIQNYYNAEIVNLGINGSSIYDLILLQIKPFIERNEYPDVCIFVWTNYARIFHRKIRNMAPTTLPKLSACYHPVVNAANEYYTHLVDWELHEYQYKSALHYFDLNTLSNFPKETKIIHIWAFEKKYSWQNGKELTILNYKSLMDLAKEGREIPIYTIDPELNHLDGDHKNILLFETIKTAIDNYE